MTGHLTNCTIVGQRLTVQLVICAGGDCSNHVNIFLAVLEGRHSTSWH